MGCLGQGHAVAGTSRPLIATFPAAGPGAWNLSAQTWVFTVGGYWYRPNYVYEIGAFLWKSYLIDGVWTPFKTFTSINVTITPGEPPNLRIVFVVPLDFMLGLCME